MTEERRHHNPRPENNGGRWYWDTRPPPGGSNDEPMCINYDCPSSFSCRRFSQEPYQGRKGTVFINPTPTLLSGLLCESFDPDVPNPSKAP